MRSPLIVQIVPQDSAKLPGYIPIGIHKNHMNMAKFGDANDPGFTAVAGELRRWSKDVAESMKPVAAPPGVQSLGQNPLTQAFASMNMAQPAPAPPATVYGGIPVNRYGLLVHSTY